MRPYTRDQNPGANEPPWNLSVSNNTSSAEVRISARGSNVSSESPAKRGNQKYVCASASVKHVVVTVDFICVTSTTPSVASCFSVAAVSSKSQSAPSASLRAQKRRNARAFKQTSEPASEFVNATRQLTQSVNATVSVSMM